jgi:hypothetical protein
MATTCLPKRFLQFGRYPECSLMRLDVTHRSDLGEHIGVILWPADDDEAPVSVVRVHGWATAVIAAALAVEP